MTSIGEKRENLHNELKVKKICRFCLTQEAKELTNIHTRDERIKATAPLPLQIVACASIEIFTNDGMPVWICFECRVLFEHGYRFKQMCKKAETLLRQYPLTGEWPEPLMKPKLPHQLHAKSVEITQNIPIPIEAATTNSVAVQKSATSKQPSTNTIIMPKINGPKKILNSNPVATPEPPAPVRMKMEKIDDETTIFLNKVENNEELSIDDVQRLIAATDSAEELLNAEVPTTSPTKNKKPKLLNKSSMRILNREAEVVVEPRLSELQIKRDEDGNVAIVTEILDPSVPYEPEPDPIKNAAPVETNVYPCPHCDRSFPLRQLRDIHMVNHKRERSFQCNECEKSFFSKYDLQKHSSIHTGERPFKCTVCWKDFSRATLLRRHERTHADIPRSICVYCEKEFISKEEMEKHAERHRKNRPFQCKLCNKSFAFKQGVERHEVIHKREQPYPCQYCDQGFSTPNKLARHLTAHAGKRPYPCKFCAKSYLLPHHLTRHVRSHKQSSTSHMCSHCDKVFKTRDELIYHSAVHATQMLVCPLCTVCFDGVDSANAHIKEHAEGEAYACEFCDLIFMSSDALQAHSDKDHIDDMAAYREDENKKADKVKGAKDAEKDLQYTIAEFLADELPEGVKILSDQVISGEFKAEVVQQDTNSPTQAMGKINEVVMQSQIVDDDNIDEANEAELNDDLEFVPEQEYAPSPAKVRKTTVAEKSKPKTTPQITKRKVAVTPPKNISLLNKDSTLAAHEKIETKAVNKVSILTKLPDQKLKQPSINSVLKSLPKSVSVKKTSTLPSTQPIAVKASTRSVTETKADASPDKIETPQGRRLLRVAAKRGTDDASSTNTVKTLPQKQTVVAKPYSSNTNSKPALKASPTAPSTSSKRNSGESLKIIGDKKVKVHTITISRAEAETMTKDGRIRIKDGNMILAQRPSKSNKLA